MTTGATTNKPVRIMGILNVTPDSFSDGGEYVDPEVAVQHALKMVQEGADIIDIGGESSRPGAVPVSEEEELRRVIPVITALRAVTDVPISIDTYKPVVARASVEAGASIINDITGLRNDEMIKTVAALKVPVIIMHMQGTPETMQAAPAYGNAVEEIVQFLQERAEAALAAGITDITLDPGIGFGKSLEHNMAILRAWSQFAALGFPTLVGTSRKSFIEKATGAPVDERLPGTIVSTLEAVRGGASIVRVHDVKEINQALNIYSAIHSL